MADIYVNISNSYSATTTIGSKTDPYDWRMFLNELSAGSELNNTYYVSGTRTLSADTTVSADATGSIVLDSWNENPWIIKNSNYSINIGLPSISVTMMDAMFQGNDINILGDDALSKHGNIVIDNCYFYVASASDFNIYWKNDVTIRNSILNSECLNLFRIGNLVIVNTILDLNDIVDAGDVTSITVSSSVATISALADYTSYSDISFNGVQSNWPTPSCFSADVDSLTTNDLHYLSADFISISGSGAKSFTNTWWNGRRDGIGALYFPEMSAVAVSANPTSAASSTSIDFALSGISGIDPFTVFSASSATFDFDDGNTSATNDGTTSHTFSADGIYAVDCSVRSHNGWYSTDASYQVVTVGAFVVVLYILDPDGNDINGTSAKPLNTLTMSAQTTSDISATRYVWTVDGQVTSSTNDYVTSAFSVLGSKNITVSAFSEADTLYSFEVDLTTWRRVLSGDVEIILSADEYYVDINSSYDSSSTHTGTSSSPFDWGEFKNRIEGGGEYQDIYRLSGSRSITKVGDSRYVLGVDKSKNMTIRDWDVSAHGPWVINVADWILTSAGSILSATGSTLKNGIIYNKPLGVLPSKGGQIIVTNLYNMFIVYQGDYSHIVINPYNNVVSGSTIISSADSQIYGSTIYVSGTGFEDNFSSGTYVSAGQTDYNLLLQDSVIVNLTPTSAGALSAATLHLYQDVFNKSLSYLTSSFNVVNVLNQFDWTPPADYPFTVDNDLYNQNISYINSNKEKLTPFDNIERPPNPGFGYDDYTDYETGLFGYQRKDFVTSGGE